MRMVLAFLSLAFGHGGSPRETVEGRKQYAWRNEINSGKFSKEMLIHLHDDSTTLPSFLSCIFQSATSTHGNN